MAEAVEVGCLCLAVFRSVGRDGYVCPLVGTEGLVYRSGRQHLSVSCDGRVCLLVVMEVSFCLFVCLFASDATVAATEATADEAEQGGTWMAG